MRIILGAAVVLALAGCSNTIVVDDVTTPVLFTRSQHGDAFEQALISGELSDLGGCFGIGETVAVFPVGTTRTDLGVSVPDFGDLDMGEVISGGGGYTTLTKDNLAQFATCDLAVGDEIVTLNPMDTN